MHFDMIFARFLCSEILHQNACEEARGPLGCVLMAGRRAREHARPRARGRRAVLPAHTHTPPPHTHSADACRSPPCVREAAAAAARSDPPRPASQKAAGGARPRGGRESAAPAPPRHVTPCRAAPAGFVPLADVTARRCSRRDVSGDGREVRPRRVCGWRRCAPATATGAPAEALVRQVYAPVARARAPTLG